MSHFPAFSLSLALAIVLGPVLVAQAEIYKWVDEKGNVHFGDKPIDAAEARAAKKIEVEQAYKPALRSDEDINQTRSEQESRWMQERAERREEEAKSSAERLEREKKKSEECARIQKTVDKFSGIQLVDGRLTRHVLVDSEGRSMTNSDQERRLAELKALAASKGCTVVFP
jgi:response regulator RpfG family c-di-GMP phosphodiesterase